MSEQMLKMKLQHLTNMGNWETGKHVHYVQCAVYTVQYMYVRHSSMYSSTVRAVMSQKVYLMIKCDHMVYTNILIMILKINHYHEYILFKMLLWKV